MRLVVSRIEEEAENIVSLELRHPDDESLPVWTPGAHIDVTVGPGLIRQYSLCGDVFDSRHYKIAVLRQPAGRGGSLAVHESVRRGQQLEIGHPRNHFPLAPASRYLFIAGGIGITPILPMIAAANHSRSDWFLHYGGRRRGSMAFINQLAHYPENVSYWPEDEKGLLPLDYILNSMIGAEIYACGPDGLLTEIMNRSISSGSTEHLHIERFAPAAGAAGMPAVSREFVAVIASTGQEIPVPANRTLLRCLLEAKVDLLYSCEEGTCGSCETRVLAGTPLHLDGILTDRQRQANDRMFPCVSRSLTERLILDL